MSKSTNLKREITPLSIMIVAISTTIGSGWLFSPLYAAQIAGYGAILSWIISAIFMIIIALPLCELGTLYPISGGLANYPKYTHGPLIGFIYYWITWLCYVVMTPIEVLAIIQYSSVYYPNLTIKSGNSVHLTENGFILALAFMAILTFINQFGIRFITEINKFVTYIKTSVLIIIIVIFLLHIQSFNNINLKNANLSSFGFWHGVFQALSIGGIAFTFTGFQNGLVLSGEIKNPQKTVPLAILGAICSCFVIYSLLQLSFMLALPPKMLVNGYSHLSFIGESGPIVGLSLMLGIGLVAHLVFFNAVIAPLSSALMYTAGNSRVLYGMAQNHFMPQFLLKLNKNNSPYIALFLNFILGLIAFFPFPGWQKMVAFLSSALIFVYGVGGICVLSLRIQKPTMNRPFRLKFVKFFSYLSFIMCNLLLYWCGFDIIWKLLFLCFLSYVIFAFSYKKSEFKFYFKKSSWFIFYMIGMCLVSAIGNYGGGYQLVPEFLDFIPVSIVSILSLYFSQFGRLKNID